MTKNSCPNCSRVSKTTGRATANKKTTRTSACSSKATTATSAKAKLLEPKTKSSTSRKVTTKSCN